MVDSWLVQMTPLLTSWDVLLQGVKISCQYTGIHRGSLSLIRKVRTLTLTWPLFLNILPFLLTSRHCGINISCMYTGSKYKCWILYISIVVYQHCQQIIFVLVLLYYCLCVSHLCQFVFLSIKNFWRAKPR